MVCATIRNTPGIRRGLTLVEAAVAMSIASIMLVAALETVGAMARARQVQSRLGQTQALAAQLMAEVLQTCYQEPTGGKLTYQHENGIDEIRQPMPLPAAEFGPEPGELIGSRLALDDVDDYAGLSEQPPRTRDGVPLANKAGWRWSVEVAWVAVHDPNLAITEDQGLKRVTVTVSDEQGIQSRLVALRWRAGFADESASAEETRVSWLGYELQVGSDIAGCSAGGVNLLNRPLVPIEP